MGIGNKEIVMAKSKKQCRNEKGDGTFRQRPNGTFEYRIVYVCLLYTSDAADEL